MKWQELTAPEFEKAVKETGRVCVVHVGCVEKHFDHLPLGTDYLNADDICARAAEKEPAVVFPSYYFGQINEARPFPGTVAVPAVLALEMLGAVCDEIARNGFSKIIFFNGHGGNRHLLNYFIQAALAERKSYALYLHVWGPSADRQEAWDAILDTKTHGHACECETSVSLAIHPHLVKTDAVAGRKSEPLGRFDHLPERGRVSARWYANHPDHYCGDATTASAEKGEKLLALMVDSLAEYIQGVKADDVVPTILNEFYDRCDDVGK